MSDHDERWVLDHLIGMCRDEEQTLRFANAVAAIKCLHLGAQSGLPTPAEVEAFLSAK